MNYTPRDWYWIVGGNGPHLATSEDQFPPSDRVYSSASGCYVSATDPNYLAWIERNQPSPTTRIDSEESLTEVLSAYGLTPKFS